MVSSENKYPINLIQTKEVIFQNIYVYTYMLVTTINQNKGHIFEREQLEAYGRI